MSTPQENEPAPVPSTSASASTSTGVADEEGTVATTTASSSKPRARLGPMEVVQLPPDSESEDEDDQEGEEGEERAIDDFLKDYPDDTEVSPLSSSPLPKQYPKINQNQPRTKNLGIDGVGPPSPTSPTQECIPTTPEVRSIRINTQTTLSEAE